MLNIKVELTDEGHMTCQVIGKKTNPIEACCIIEELVYHFAHNFNMDIDTFMELLKYCMSNNDDEEDTDESTD